MKVTLSTDEVLDCEDRPIASGAVSDVYFSLDRSRAVKLYKQPVNVNVQALELLLAYSDQVFSNSEMVEMICWPLGIVISPRLGITMPAITGDLLSLSWFTMSKPIAKVKAEDRGNWLDRVAVALKICKIVGHLHQIGMVITDIAPRNFLASLPAHRLVMLDCDGIMPPGTNAPHVLGTPEYQAPEIVMGEWPNQQSDLHSLAVLIYRLLFLQHPLLGPQVHSPDPVQDDNLALGEKALFIEHPLDYSNRPASMTIQSKDFGDQFFKVVLGSFVDGLNTPQKRPSAEQWHTALSKLSAELRPCTNPNCVGKYSVPRLNDKGCYWCFAPYKTMAAVRESISRNTVFISYSHADERWLKRLRVHLRPLERTGKIEVWDDTRITPGTRWRQEIKEALDSAKVAVLLVSADFLASDFIAENELPPLLKAAEKEGTIILPVILSPSVFNDISLAQFQSVNAPSKPLLDMTKAQQEEVFVRIAQAIERALFTP